ncbi:MAG: apolipoprotein N-acyltransferase, partial [Betaproteobacteria bacterium AqS2]|nr:apolipoprotein N-acyltransferase [Betaproteobacteria bacterium AqS2]
AEGRGAALGAAAALLVAGWLLRGVDHLPASSEGAFEASVVQGAVPQDRQWLAENVHELPALYLQLFAEASGRIAVAPESALPFQWEDLDPATREAYASRGLFRHFILGTFTRDEETGRSRNAAALLSPGEAPRFYAKRHLTPYGEYLPFAALLEPLLQRARIPYANLQPGTTGGVFNLAGTVIDLSICYESLFPRLFARDPQVALLATITNDSWFDGTAMPAQHLQIAAGRALERQRYMLRASNTGPSAVIRPDGTLAASIAPLQRGVAAAQVERRQGLTPYMRWGDAPLLVPALMALAWLLLGALRRGTSYMKG